MRWSPFFTLYGFIIFIFTGRIQEYMVDMTELENKLEYTFKNREYLKLALSHSSYVNEMTVKKQQCNERIEFLGDAVLELVSSEFLYKNCPSDKEGVLSKHRASLVCEKSLAAAARKINLGDFILLGRGEKNTGGADRDSILADAFEAVIGAMYLDGGYDRAAEFIKKLLLVNDETMFVDYKSRYQELVQGRFGEKIVYELVGESGPEHDRNFEVILLLDGVKAGHGVGHNKKAAEQMAAKEALEAINKQTVATGKRN